jgi:uncharacterized membrane protein
MNLWPLVGLGIVILGFAVRLNPVLVVALGGLATGLAAGFPPVKVLELLGEAFVKNRFLAFFLLTLPVVGLLESHGLRERARDWVGGFRDARPGRLLAYYFLARQASAAIGLTSLGGHAQTVRPLLAPMAEAAAEQAAGAPLATAARERLKALCAATDNVAVFFGEDIFLAFGAVLLIQGFLGENGLRLEPLRIALWGVPTAIAAYAIHVGRLRRLDRSFGAEPGPEAAP